MKRPWALWFGFLGPPIIWAARFGISYALVPLACARGSVLSLVAITVIALVATALAGLVAFHAWRTAGSGPGAEPPDAARRTRFMAIAGMLGAGLFFAVIAVEGLAVLYVDPCRSGGAPL